MKKLLLPIFLLIAFSLKADGLIHISTDGTGVVAFTSSPPVGDNSTNGATTQFVTAAITNAVAGVNPAVAVKAATAGIPANFPTYKKGAAGSSGYTPPPNLKHAL